MKKYLGLILTFILAFILIGCINFNTTVEITRTKEVNFSMIYALDKSMSMLAELAHEGDRSYRFSEKDKKEFAEKGFKVEDYKDGNYEGIKLIKSWKNIDEISGDTDETYEFDNILGRGKNNSNKIFKVENGLFKNKYTL